MTERYRTKAVVRVLAALLLAGLWIFIAGPAGGDDPVPEWIGKLISHIGLALLFRWIYVRARKRPREDLWSPWLFAIAAGLAMLGRFGENS